MKLNWVGLLVLLVAGYLLTHNLTAWKDVEFGDETTYLGSGLAFSIPFQGGAQWGPLYAAWYAFWHLFIPDRLDLYYFNWALLSVLSGLVVFGYLRSMQVTFWVSLWVGVLFLFSAQNLPLNPKISIAPFSLIISALAFNRSQRLSAALQMLLVSFVGLLCAYCRPEFYLSFLMGLLIFVWLGWKERKTILQSKNAFIVGGLLSGALVLHLLFGNPLFSGDSSRSAVAFQQHFVVNYCAWKGQPEPATIEAQLKLFHQVLGNDVETLTDALVQQPQWALKHIGNNLANTLRFNLSNMVELFYQTLFRGWYSPWRILVVGLLGLLLLVMLDYRKIAQQFRQKPIEWFGLIQVFVLIFPTLIATLLVYPRTHYLVFHWVLISWLIAFVVNRLAFNSWVALRLKIVDGVLIGALLVYLGVRLQEYARVAPTPNADNVRVISQIVPKQRLRVLEREWYRVFLKQPSDWIHVEEYTDGDFVGFVRVKQINFILMTRDMQTFFAKDAGFQDFLKRHESEGFQKIKTNETGEFLLVKKMVL